MDGDEHQNIEGIPLLQHRRRFPIITVCGSMRYFDQMMEAANVYSKEGWIVQMPFVAYIKPGEQENNPVKEMLDKMHFAKIDMSEAILVVGSHRGESTTKEIAYAIEGGLAILEWMGDVHNARTV